MQLEKFPEDLTDQQVDQVCLDELLLPVDWMLDAERVKKWLAKQSHETIAQIAADCGWDAVKAFNREAGTAFIVEYAKSYRVNAADFQARYQYDSRVVLVK